MLTIVTVWPQGPVPGTNRWPKIDVTVVVQSAGTGKELDGTMLRVQDPSVPMLDFVRNGDPETAEGDEKVAGVFDSVACADDSVG